MAIFALCKDNKEGSYVQPYHGEDMAEFKVPASEGEDIRYGIWREE